MRLPEFVYFEPNDIKAAVSILQEEPSARILAGGTDLLVNMKHQLEHPAALVNIKRIAGLDFVKHNNGAIRIGALTPLKRIYTTPYIAEKVPAIAQAAASVGAYHLQTMGTLAGNLCQQNRCEFYNQSRWWRSARPTCFKAGGEVCHVMSKKGVCYSSYCGDVAPALLVMNAKIVLTGTGGSREIPLENLFSGDGKAPFQLEQTDIITEVVIPKEAMLGSSGYIKFASRESIDFPVVGTAFWGSEEHKKYRVAFTAVDRKPLRGKNIEAFLKGKDLNNEVMNAACDLAATAAAPAKTSVYTPAYKRKMMGVLLLKAVNKAMGR